jgi:hypothetical protein
MTRFILRRAAAASGAAMALAFAGGCESANTDEETTVAETAGPSATAKAAKLPTSACPLVDTDLLPTLFKVSGPKLEEKDPVKIAGSATAYTCDVSDGGELFLTVGVSVAPPSGSAKANVTAALEGVAGEPVAGVGEAGAFAAKDGVGTVAGVKSIGGKYVLVFVYGAADDKKQLISVAQSASSRV